MTKPQHSGTAKELVKVHSNQLLLPVTGIEPDQAKTAPSLTGST